MFSENVQKIFDEIMADKENKEFTDAGIKPGVWQLQIPFINLKPL